MGARAGLTLAILTLASLAALPSRGDAVLSGVVGIRIGGASGIEMDTPGLRATILGDRGTVHEIELRRDAAGDLVGVGRTASRPFLDRSGAPMGPVDSDGLARRADGRWYVAFEGRRPRVLTWPPGARAAWGPAAGLTALEPAPGLRRNEGLEALAATPAGILAISEGDGPGGHPVRLWTGTRWQFLPPLPTSRGGFRPTGADWGPDGHLYLLERRRGGIAFAARVRRFALGPNGLAGGAVVLAIPPARQGNLEGLAAWRDGAGILRLTMVSDDNFLPIQRAEVIEYALPHVEVVGSE